MTKQELLAYANKKGVTISIWILFESASNNENRGEFFKVTRKQFKERINKINVKDGFTFDARYYEETNYLCLN